MLWGSLVEGDEIASLGRYHVLDAPLLTYGLSLPTASQPGVQLHQDGQGHKWVQLEGLDG
jgi:hypothetical protein